MDPARVVAAAGLALVAVAPLLGQSTARPADRVDLDAVVQDPIDYGTRTHHSNMDPYDACSRST